MLVWTCPFRPSGASSVAQAMAASSSLVWSYGRSARHRRQTVLAISRPYSLLVPLHLCGIFPSSAAQRRIHLGASLHSILPHLSSSQAWWALKVHTSMCRQAAQSSLQLTFHMRSLRGPPKGCAGARLDFLSSLRCSSLFLSCTLVLYMLLCFTKTVDASV